MDSPLGGPADPSAANTEAAAVARMKLASRRVRRLCWLCLVVSSALSLGILLRIGLLAPPPAPPPHHTRHVGNFYSRIHDGQAAAELCGRLFRKLGKPSDVYRRRVDPHSHTYCHRLALILRTCLLQDSADESVLPNLWNTQLPHHQQTTQVSDFQDLISILDQNIPNSDVLRSANILVIYPHEVDSEQFIDSFLSNFVSSLQLQSSTSIQHTPAFYCSSFISAIDIEHENSVTVVYGPRTFGIHEVLARRRKNLYILWVSHPRQRLSRHHKSNAKDKLHHENNSDNLLVRSLIFRPNFTSEDQLNVFAQDSNYTQNIIITEKHYLQALYNVKNYVGFIGLSEHAQISKNMLCHAFDMPITCFGAPRRKGSASVSAEMTAELERANRWDLLLYEEIESIFEQQVESFNSRTHHVST